MATQAAALKEKPTKTNQKDAALKLASVVKETLQKAANESKIEKTIDASLRVETIMVPFNEILKLDQNPRGNLSPEGVAELADSLMTEQIQDLGAIREDGKIYIFLGYRRLAAFEKNVTEGRINENYPVRITIWNVTRNEAFMMAFTENVLREEMSPLDECDGVAQMLNLGYSQREIANKTGLKTTKISDFALVSSSSDEVRSLVSTKKRSVSWASSLAKMGDENINSILASIRTNPESYTSVVHLEKVIRLNKVPIGNAIFDIKKSGITTVKDLFEDTLEYFAETAEFWEHQLEAIEVMKGKLEEDGHTSVEVIRNAPFPQWKYTDAETAIGSLAFIEVKHDGEVIAHTKKIDPTVTESTTDLSHIFGGQTETKNESHDQDTNNPENSITVVPPSGKTASTLSRIRADAALQLVSKDDRLIKRVLLASLMGQKPYGLKRPNDMLDSDYNTADSKTSLENFTYIRRFEEHVEAQPLEIMAYLLTLEDDYVEDMIAKYTLATLHRSDGKKMIFGENNPAKAIMDTMEVSLRSNWTPDKEFFEVLNLQNLREIAYDVLPAADASMAKVTARNDLIVILTQAFQNAAENPFDENSPKLNNWVPTYL